MLWHGRQDALGWCLIPYPTAFNSVFQHSSCLIRIPYTSLKQQGSLFLLWFLCLSISIKPRIVIKTVMRGNNVQKECFIKIKCRCWLGIWIVGLFNCPCASALKCVGEGAWRVRCGPTIYQQLIATDKHFLHSQVSQDIVNLCYFSSN